MIIGITQPRRVAAITLAKRVAEEMNCKLGKEVGYVIRFDDCFEDGITMIKYMTEGILIREMMKDPLLKSYSVIMVDEVHERTLFTDIVLGLLKKIIRKRPELRLIISSATIELNLFTKYFTQDGISINFLSIHGRTYPVEIFYTQEPVSDYLRSAIDTVIKIHENLPYGDILVFLTGQEEVEKVVETLFDYAKEIKERTDLKRMYVLPMYSMLPFYDQLKVFEQFPKSVRKVVVATNIAETSVTINGIVYVVDCGFVKLRFYNTKTCTNSLIVVPISQASAEQRAGRAGRTRPGKAFRLFTEKSFQNLMPFTIPEMQRSSLIPVILQLKALKVNNVVKFSLISKPPEYNFIKSLEILYALQALDDKANLTDPLGIQMAEIPLDAMFAKMLLNSEKMECSEEVLTIVSMLQVENIFNQPSNGQKSIQAQNSKHHLSVEEGDLITYLNVYNCFIKANKVKSWSDRYYLNYKGLLRAVEIRTRLKSILKKFKVKLISAEGDVNKIIKCIVSGFFPNAAYLHPSGVYKTIRGNHQLSIHPTSVLYTLPKPPNCVVFVEVLQTTQEFMRDLTAIDYKWLYQLAPHFYEYGTDRELAEQNLINQL